MYAIMRGLCTIFTTDLRSFYLIKSLYLPQVHGESCKKNLQLIKMARTTHHCGYSFTLPLWK